MRTAPEKMPAAPTPLMALPRMKAVEEGAAPQMAEPISKSRIVDKSKPLMDQKIYSLPKDNWNAAFVSR